MDESLSGRDFQDVKYQDHLRPSLPGLYARFK